MNLELAMHKARSVTLVTNPSNNCVDNKHLILASANE